MKFNSQVRITLSRFFVVAMIAFVVASCSASKSDDQSPRTVIGSIYVTGNEPFTKLAIQQDNGDVFILKCRDDLKKMLWGQQGKKVKVTGRVTDPEPEGNALEVLSAELIPSSTK